MRAPLSQFIDSTMLVQLRACPRKFFWEYVLCLRPRGRKIDLIAGGAFAAGLEAARLAHHFGADKMAVMKAAWVGFDKAWGDNPPMLHETKNYLRTLATLYDYLDFYPLATDHIRPLLREVNGLPAYEFSFALPLTGPEFPLHPVSGEPFVYVGRFDTFGFIDNTKVISDEKTTGRSFGDNWHQQWKLRNQFIGYTWASCELGHACTTVAIRGVLIQKTQSQFIEHIQTYSPTVLDKFRIQLARDLHRLCDFYNSGFFDYNFGDTCSAYNRGCAFLDLCEESHPQRWFGDFSRERWLPADRTSAEIPHDEYSEWDREVIL